MTDKYEITCREFLEKIMAFNGDGGALIDNSANGRYELRIYVNGGVQEYLSPRLYDMPVRDAVDFESSIEAEAFRKMPRLSRYRV